MSIDVRERRAEDGRVHPRTMRFPSILAIGGPLATLALGALAFPYTVDDAFVLARYARRVAAGQGWTMVDGPPTDGLTGPLGIVPGLVSELLGGDALAGAKLCGGLAAALAVGLGARTLSRRAGGGRTVPVFLALATVQTSLAIWSVAGLETGLATLAATLATLGALARPFAPYRLGFAVGALTWLRPECGFFGATLLAISIGRPRWRMAWALAGLAVAALCGFRREFFGGWLPLSFSAKPAELGPGLGYALRGGLAVTGLAGLGLLVVGARCGSRYAGLTAALVAHFVAIVLSGGDWMPGFRLFAPIVPTYALLAARGTLVRGWWWMPVLAVAVSVPGIDLAIQLVGAREAGARRDLRGPLLCDVVNDSLAETDRSAVALVDIGYVGYVCGIAPIVDLAGITDPRIAYTEGGHLAKRFPVTWLDSRDVGLVVLRSFVPPAFGHGRITRMQASPLEMRIAGSPWVWARFRLAAHLEWTPGYHYIFLVRRERSTRRESVWQDERSEVERRQSRARAGFRGRHAIATRPELCAFSRVAGGARPERVARVRREPAGALLVSAGVRSAGHRYPERGRYADPGGRTGLTSIGLADLQPARYRR